MSVHIKGAKPPVFSMSKLPDDVKFAQSLEEAFTPLIESGHLDAIAALGHPIKSAADLDAWAKLGPDVAPENKGKALKHPFTKKVAGKGGGKTGGNKLVHVTVTPAPAPKWPLDKPIPWGEAEQFVADNPDIFKPQVITNDPAKYVKNPAFDAEFQAKVKAEKKAGGIKVKIKKSDGTATAPVTAHVSKLNLDGQVAYPPMTEVPKTAHEYDLVIFNETHGKAPAADKLADQISTALKDVQGGMLAQVMKKFDATPGYVKELTAELNDKTKAAVYKALYGGSVLDYAALLAETDKGTVTTATANQSVWANKTQAEIVADIASVLKVTKPVPYNEGGIKVIGDAVQQTMTAEFPTPKTFKYDFDLHSLAPAPADQSVIDAFNQTYDQHLHKDSDMIKAKTSGMAMTAESMAAKASEDQEPGLEFGVSTEEANSEVLQLVDEFTELERQIQAADVSELLKKQDDLKKQLQSIAKSGQFPAHKPVQLWGTHENYVQFSEQKSMQKITDKPGLIDAIGMAKYMANTDITLANAKKLLSENELDKFTSTMPGPRTLNAIVVGKSE